jgi:hypothetical protein
MSYQSPVHEIRVGAVRATVWEASAVEGPRYRISIARVKRPGEFDFRADRFDPEDLPLVAEAMDLAHLWICEQAELVA